MQRSLSTAGYLLLNGFLWALWFLAMQILWSQQGLGLFGGFVCVAFSMVVELLFRVAAERKIARRLGRAPDSIRTLLTRRVFLQPVPNGRAYLSQTSFAFVVSCAVLFGLGALLGTRTFPLFTFATPLLVAQGFLRPLFVERNPLGLWPGRGLFRAGDPI